jgi:hypothetical protein
MLILAKNAGFAIRGLRFFQERNPREQRGKPVISNEINSKK